MGNDVNATTRRELQKHAHHANRRIVGSTLGGRQAVIVSTLEYTASSNKKKFRYVCTYTRFTYPLFHPITWTQINDSHGTWRSYVGTGPENPSCMLNRGIGALDRAFFYNIPGNHDIMSRVYIQIVYAYESWFNICIYHTTHTTPGTCHHQSLFY